MVQLRLELQLASGGSSSSSSDSDGGAAAAAAVAFGRAALGSLCCAVGARAPCPTELNLEAGSSTWPALWVAKAASRPPTAPAVAFALFFLATPGCQAPHTGLEARVTVSESRESG